MESLDPSNNNIEEIDIEKLLVTIITQTDYSREFAIEKLKEFDYDYMKVIRDYLGTSNIKHKNKSLNQEIYSQIRNHLY